MDLETDLRAVTARQQAMWSQGDFHKIGVTQAIVGERLVEALEVHAGERVLDVAAGAGNTALAAARRWGVVTCTDYVPDLLERASTRAAVEGLTLTTEVADAQALPYADGSYDVVTSTYGAMFAPDQEATARELVRVLVPGGRLGMANWIPDSMVGRMFALAGSFAPAAPALRPATRWGTVEGLEALLGDTVVGLSAVERTVDFVYPSLDFMLDHFRTWLGPVSAQFAALDTTGQAALADGLLGLWGGLNTATDGTVLMAVPYLEVTATKA